MSRPRIGHPGDTVDRHVVASCQRCAAAVADLLHVPALVGRRGIPEIDPEERADAELVAGRGFLLDTLGRDQRDLTAPELLLDPVAQVRKCACLHRDAEGTFPLADDERRPAKAIPGSIDSLIRQEKQGARAVDLLLAAADSIDDGLSRIDERSRYFGGIEALSRCLREMSGPLLESRIHDLADVVDPAHRDDGIVAEVRADDQGLILRIADAPDTLVAFHLRDIVVELGAELSVFDVVDETVEVRRVPHCHAAASGSEVRMEISPVKEVEYTIFLGDDTEYSAHRDSFPGRRHCLVCSWRCSTP